MLGLVSLFLANVEVVEWRECAHRRKHRKKCTCAPWDQQKITIGNRTKAWRNISEIRSILQKSILQQIVMNKLLIIDGRRKLITSIDSAEKITKETRIIFSITVNKLSYMQKSIYYKTNCLIFKFYYHIATFNLTTHWVLRFQIFLNSSMILDKLNKQFQALKQKIAWRQTETSHSVSLSLKFTCIVRFQKNYVLVLILLE